MAGDSVETATDSASVAISLKSSHRAVAPAHRYVWNAVLDEWFPGYLEAKPLVPGPQPRLRIEDDVIAGPVGQLERAPHQARGQSAGPRGRGSSDPADPGHPGVANDAERCEDRTGVVGHPQQPGIWLEIPPVELAIRTALLDDEDVDPQLQYAVQRCRADLGRVSDVNLEPGLGHVLMAPTCARSIR